MIRLNELYIKGFKEPEREIHLTFSKEPITVLYGENGSGKTTLLQVLHALLVQDSEFLSEQNIQELQLNYSLDGQDKKISFKAALQKFDDDTNGVFFNKTQSILFGVHRGVIQKYDNLYELNKMISFASENQRKNPEQSLPLNEKVFFLGELFAHLFKTEISEFIKNKNLVGQLLDVDDRLKTYSLISNKNLVTDFIGINKIKQALSAQFYQGQMITFQSVKNALSNTISNAVNIELNEDKSHLPELEQIVEKLTKHKDFPEILQALEDSPLKTTLKDLLEGKDVITNLQSKIFRALLVNLLKVLETENYFATSVDTLIETFNSHLGKNKKLVVTAEEAYIDLGNKRKHELNELSSGERHLLTFLTVFLIWGKEKDIFLIDEPEVSLNLKWQRKFLPLLSELNPNAQIIAATHSPAIANKNTNYLIELT